MAVFATFSAVVCAAKGVLFFAPLNPLAPEEDHVIVSPWRSVMVIMVLLNVDLICVIPFIL